MEQFILLYEPKLKSSQRVKTNALNLLLIGVPLSNQIELAQESPAERGEKC